MRRGNDIMTAIMQAHTQCSVTCRANSLACSGESSKPRSLRESGVSPEPALRSRRASFRVALCVLLDTAEYSGETLFHFFKCLVVIWMRWNHARASLRAFGQVSTRRGPRQFLTSLVDPDSSVVDPDSSGGGRSHRRRVGQSIPGQGNLCAPPASSVCARRALTVTCPHRSSPLAKPRQ